MLTFHGKEYPAKIGSASPRAPMWVFKDGATGEVYDLGYLEISWHLHQAGRRYRVGWWRGWIAKMEMDQMEWNGRNGWNDLAGAASYMLAGGFSVHAMRRASRCDRV